MRIRRPTISRRSKARTASDGTRITHTFARTVANSSKIILTATALTITGCAINTVQQFRPSVTDLAPADQPIYEADLKQCTTVVVAELQKQHLDPGGIGEAGVTGGFNTSLTAAASLQGPVVGVAAGAGKELFAELNLMSERGLHMVAKCMEHKGLKSGKYNIIDYNQ